MENIAVFLFFVCIGTCACLNSWELPEGNLWMYIDHDLDDNWMQFKKSYNRTYQNNDEEMKRRLIWEDTTRFIEAHNKKYDAGEETFTVGENHFTDMTEDEFQKIYLTGLVIPDNGVDHDGPEDQPEEYPELIEPDLEIPNALDWRHFNRVTDVRDQGNCGSCWAFAAVAAIEGQEHKYGRKQDLSEQNLVDCDTAGSKGCSGGWMDSAYAYVMNGIQMEADYPYKARDQRCQFNSNKQLVKDKGYEKVKKTEAALQMKVATVGPISIAVDIRAPFQAYKTGVYYNPYCSQQPNHAMTVVGYGTKNRKDYWIVKNSWGKQWGDKGYVLMSRNKNNQCGIANHASFPIM